MSGVGCQVWTEDLYGKRKDLHKKMLRIMALLWLIWIFSPVPVFAQDNQWETLEKRISVLEQEVAELKDANAMLVENLINCGRENEGLREEIQQLQEKLKQSAE